MESGRSYDLPGSSEPPPYTISDGLHPVPINPSCPPSKSPLPNRRPYEAFGDNPSNTYGSYPPCQMSQGQVAYGQMPYGNGQTFHGQMPHGQMPPVHTGGSYGYGYPQGQTYPTPQFCAPGQAPYYPSYALPPQRPPQQQQQQQQSVVIIGGTTPRYNQPVTFVQSFSGHISLACFVFWCCGGLFGLVAFVLAGKHPMAALLWSIVAYIGNRPRYL